MSESTATPEAMLSVPVVPAAHFTRNFIRQVVCELRFPTLFELEGTKPPTSFAQALRKEYPTYEAVKNLNVTAGGLAQANGHLFREKKGRWSVALRASAITLECFKYDSFSEFESRLGVVLKAAEKVIDSDVYTRVGLRYINSVPLQEDDIEEWINPALVGVLGSGLYGTVDEHSQRVAGRTPEGQYLFQHGIGVDQETKKQHYVLDFDFSSEDVPVAEAMDIVKKLHTSEFSMFIWALGPKAKSYLGSSTS